MNLQNLNQVQENTAQEIAVLRKNSNNTECNGTQLAFSQKISQLLDNFEPAEQKAIQARVSEILQNKPQENIQKCPFSKISKWLTRLSKSTTSQQEQQNSAQKHKEYLQAIRNSLQSNKTYFENIHHTVSQKEKSAFQLLSEKERISFLNNSMKKHFWNGIDIPSNISKDRIQNLVNIGNLGIDDVTEIFFTLINQNPHKNIQEVLQTLDEEIFLRLKNNMLVDAILHLEEWKETLISNTPNKSAEKIEKLLQSKFNTVPQLFPLDIIPSGFQQAMKKDGLIKNQGFIPQRTFGCPIVNIQNGKIFRTFVQNFLKAFHST